MANALIRPSRTWVRTLYATRLGRPETKPEPGGRTGFRKFTRRNTMMWQDLENRPRDPEPPDREIRPVGSGHECTDGEPVSFKKRDGGLLVRSPSEPPTLEGP